MAPRIEVLRSMESELETISNHLLTLAGDEEADKFITEFQRVQMELGYLQTAVETEADLAESEIEEIVS